MARIVWDTGIHGLLLERYPAPAWATFFEVASGIGRHSGRYADAITMSLFPSRGLDFHGFEIKHNRADWLRELKNPEKADLIASYCDYWWVVISDEKIVKLDEVPRPWGVLVRKGASLVQTKAAKRLKARKIDRTFVAALLRRAEEMAANERKLAQQKYSDTPEIKKSYEKGKKAGIEEANEDFKMETANHSSLKREVAEFERKSGLDINQWNGGRLGEAVESLRYLKKTTSVESLHSAAESLEKAAQELRSKASALFNAPDQIPPRVDSAQEPLVNGKVSP